MKNKTCMFMSIAAAALAAYASFGATVVGDGIKDPLEELFANPPKEAHAGAWWHWMGGQVTKAGIEKDLDWFVRMGITSATIFGMADATVPWAKRIANVPTGGMRPYDDEWWRLVKFACAEGKKRGIDIGLQLSAIITPVVLLWYIFTELGSIAEDGSFEAFVERILSNKVSFEDMTVKYESENKAFDVKYSEHFKINGEVVNTDYARYESPYVNGKVERFSETIEFSFGGKKLTLNYKNGTREEQK